MSTGPRSPAQTPPEPSPGSALDLTGRTVGDFKVLRKLGQGGMGQVYLAEQQSLQRKVALKILRPELAANETALARFREEALNSARVTHANIVQVYACGDVESMPYIALEYVEGRNLRDFIAKKGPPELPVALSIMRQIASALQRACELGIIHRDIKPENILLTRKGEVKVVDFGLSRCLEADRPALNLTQTGVTMGTPLYMSPEQVEGKQVDSRTDIYSLGITCYHMLAGHPPFRGSSPFEVALQHVKKEPVPLAEKRPDLPPYLCHIVHKMMAKDPAMRYQTGRDLLRDLTRLREALGTPSMSVPVVPAPLSGQSVPVVLPVEDAQAAPTRTAPVPPVPTRRRGAARAWLAVALLLSLALAVGAGGAGAWLDHRNRAAAPPGDEDLRPADATRPNVLLQPDRREEELRAAAERLLAVPPGQKAPDPSGAPTVMALGAYYLEHGRLDDARRLFDRLAGLKESRPLAMAGRFGQAIELALRDRPKESNALFVELFALPGQQPPPPRKNKPSPTRPGAAWRQYFLPIDAQVAPLKPLLSRPEWQYWLQRARWYNKHNGLPDRDVPPYLVWLEVLGKANERNNEPPRGAPVK